MGEEVRMISEKEMQELVGMVERAIQWEEVVQKMELKDGDILLVNARVIDPDKFMRVKWAEGTPNVLVVPVVCEEGESLEKAMKTISRERAIELLGQIVGS